MKSTTLLLSISLALLCRASAADTAETLELGSKLALKATADGNPPPTFEWYKNGTKLADGDSFVVSVITSADAGDYTAKASNTLGAATSDKYSIAVDDRVPPVFTMTPVGTKITEGQSLVLAATANGKPTPSIKWQKEGAEIPGATTDRLFFEKVAKTDAGTYFAVATNEKGSVTSPPALVEVVPAPVAPVITSAFSNLAVQKKTTVVLRVVAVGDGLSYRWKKGTSNLAGKVNSELVIPSVNPSDEGTYTVTVANAFGSVSASAKLSVIR